MKIWKLSGKVDNGYDQLVSETDWTADMLQSFDGRRHLPNWTPAPVKRLAMKNGLQLNDCTECILGTFPAFSKKALDSLLPLMGESVEVLPLDFAEKEYYGINVIDVVDAINYERSVYETFSDGKRIMYFKKYYFDMKSVANKIIFKIKDEPRRDPFVTELFIKAVEENGLTGFDLKLVWDSEKD